MRLVKKTQLIECWVEVTSISKLTIAKKSSSFFRSLVQRFFYLSLSLSLSVFWLFSFHLKYLCLWLKLSLWPIFSWLVSNSFECQFHHFSLFLSVSIYPFNPSHLRFFLPSIFFFLKSSEMSEKIDWMTALQITYTIQIWNWAQFKNESRIIAHLSDALLLSIKKLIIVSLYHHTSFPFLRKCTKTHTHLYVIFS